MRAGTIVGLAGLAGSVFLIVVGILGRRRPVGSRRRTTPVFWLGVVGLLLSAGWLILGAYIDAVTS